MATKINLIFDTVIFLGFLVISNPHLTGNTIHEWLGVSFAATIITHLLLHWEWIMKVGKEFFRKLWHQSRLNFAVNILFFYRHDRQPVQWIDDLERCNVGPWHPTGRQP
jgi:hypothetical protein